MKEIGHAQQGRVQVGIHPQAGGDAIKTRAFNRGIGVKGDLHLERVAGNAGPPAGTVDKQRHAGPGLGQPGFRVLRNVDDL